jgi:hypothetical protein
MDASRGEAPVGQEAEVTLELSRLLRISTRFARAFTLRYAERGSLNAFCDRPLLAEAVAATREWRVVPFPPLPPVPEAGFPQDDLKPDLLIAGIGRGRRWLFQLLLDVRVAAPLGSTWVGGRKLSRPAAHAAVWDLIAAKDAAEQRYVGTLSRGDLDDWRADFDRLPLAHIRPARDVQWVPELSLTVREALGEMSDGERRRFEPELRAFLRQVGVLAPQLRLAPPRVPFAAVLAVRRARWQRERAAARSRI